jgi:alanine dehydrogenase
MAAGLGANVIIMDVNLDRLRYLSDMMPANVNTMFCDPHTVEDYAPRADLVIGAVLIPGGRAPMLMSRALVSKMKPGSVIVDVSIDQGGCIETSHPTTHSDPVYVVDGVVHYGVTNIPGAVSRTSSLALCNATLPYARQIASMGVRPFAAHDPGHAAAINMADHKLANAAVAQAFPDLPAAS